MTSLPRSFEAEAFVDFVDDALIASRPLTPRDLDAMMATLASWGIRRVSWGYYGDGHGGMLCPEAYTLDKCHTWRLLGETYRRLGNPLRVAVEAGHRHGMEVYAYFKPYETGPGLLFPDGSPAAADNGLLDHRGGRLGWMDPFVRDHPHLRIARRRDAAVPDPATQAVHSLRLVKSDDKPTRITPERLQIWTSAHNWRYQRCPAAFTFEQSIERSPREVRDQSGRLITAAGAPVRVLTLSGLSLDDAFILVTTDFAEGGDFSNSGTALLEARDASGRPIEGSFATGSTVYCGALMGFREQGLTYDFGWGRHMVTLDAPSADGRTGLIAFTRGRNAYLPGALCEAEPQVCDFWFKCLEEMIDAGVDGVDFREENHSTHTDFPEEYGYNDVVLARCSESAGEALRAQVAAVRGNAFTAFLGACKARLTRAGKPLRYNLQLDFFRPDPPPQRLLAFPLNIDFQWRRWIDQGILDRAILRFYSPPCLNRGGGLAEVLRDSVAVEMMDRCAAAGLPMAVNRYIGGPGEAGLGAEVGLARADPRLSGYIFYETAEYLRFEDEGRCVITKPWVEQAARAASR